MGIAVCGCGFIPHPLHIFIILPFSEGRVLGAFFNPFRTDGVLVPHCAVICIRNKKYVVINNTNSKILLIPLETFFAR